MSSRILDVQSWILQTPNLAALTIFPPPPFRWIHSLRPLGWIFEPQIWRTSRLISWIIDLDSKNEVNELDIPYYPSRGVNFGVGEDFLNWPSKILITKLLWKTWIFLIIFCHFINIECVWYLEQLNSACLLEGSRHCLWELFSTFSFRYALIADSFEIFMCNNIDAVLSCGAQMSSCETLIDIMTGVTVKEHSGRTLASIRSSLVLALCAFIAGVYVFWAFIYISAPPPCAGFSTEQLLKLQELLHKMIILWFKACLWYKKSFRTSPSSQNELG